MVALSACTGSSSTAVPNSQTSSASSTATVLTSTSGTSSVSATSADGDTVIVQLPAASARVAVTETLSDTAPSGYASSRAAHGGLFAERGALAGLPGAILYIVLASTAPVTFDGPPSVDVALPSITADAYYLAGLSSSGTTTFTEGPGAISGTTVNFGALTAAPSITIAPSDPLVIEFYAPANGAAPSPVASSTPVPLVAVPTSLTFASATSPSQTFSVTQSGIAGAFTVATTPANIVSVAPGAVSGAYIVTPVGVGTATITITGSGGGSTTVTATVEAATPS
jgi:hypothetical protein